MATGTKLALVVFYTGFVGIVVGGCLASVSVPQPSAQLVLGIRAISLLLLAGAVLCWRAGWRRFTKECTPFAGKSPTRFVVYVMFAPYTLPFRDIEFPRWLP
jgi:hypothetical protein